MKNQAPCFHSHVSSISVRLTFWNTDLTTLFDGCKCFHAVLLPACHHGNHSNCGLEPPLLQPHFPCPPPTPQALPTQHSSHVQWLRGPQTCHALSALNTFMGDWALTPFDCWANSEKPSLIPCCALHSAPITGYRTLQGVECACVSLSISFLGLGAEAIS